MENEKGYSGDTGEVLVPLGLQQPQKYLNGSQSLFVIVTKQIIQLEQYQKVKRYPENGMF